MVDWIGNGQAAGFAIRNGSPGLYIDAVNLSSNGSIDTAFITRMQYRLDNRNLLNRVRATADFQYNLVTDDRPNRPDGKRDGWAAVMWVATHNAALPAGAPAGAKPTPWQIITAPGVQIFPGVRTGTSGPTGLKFRFDGPIAHELTPNTKYWLVVAPTLSRMNNKGDYVAPKQQGSHRILELGKARAVSFWSNRKPGKPTIISPPHRSVVNSGSQFNLQISPNDPDAMGTGNATESNIIGVHVQYAEQPSPENPSPTWQDLQTKTFTSGWQPGYTFYGASDQSTKYGAITLMDVLGWMVVSTGVEANTQTHPPGGFLPMGNWQIRVRTYDAGNPYAGTNTDLSPLAGTPKAWTPANYPAANTSPWSDPVYVTVPTQVPAPIPLSPRDSVAVPLPPPDPANGYPISERVYLRWRYRNTANPPRPQAELTVERKRSTDSTWSSWTFQSSAKALSFSNLSLPGNKPVEWTWRVKVKDDQGFESPWSEYVSFWIVPRPQSGDTKPLPVSTIDGATLGCGTHRVFVYRRGGTERVGELRNLSLVDWGRVRDDPSTARVRVSHWDVDCGELLKKLQCWAYELVIFRDNGYSQDRVWEGPITLISYTADSVTIQAKDVMGGYIYRRILRPKMSDTANGDSVINRAVKVIQHALAPDDPNVLAHLNPIVNENDPKQYRSTPAWSRTAFEEVDDMASNAGLDYTVVGRSILLWTTKYRIGTLPEFRDKDLGSPPIVTEYGMSMANHVAVTDGNGVFGDAARGPITTDGRGNTDGRDENYGLVEILSSTWASESAGEEEVYTQEAVEKLRDSFVSFAEKAITDRYPPPVVVRVPDNTTLNPETVLSIQHLVPGVAVPLRSSGTLREVVAIQKLDSMRVVEQDGQETISITLSPFNREDSEFVEGDFGDE